MRNANGVAMSETSRADLAYPKSKVDAATAFWFSYCGGSGAGACYLPLGVTQYVYPIRVPKFTVFNRSLLLTNNNEIDIVTDAGNNGLCPNSFGTRQPWWLAFSATGVMTDAEVKARGRIFNQAAYPAYDIFVQSKDLPQPNDPAWQGRIYVHIVWDSPLYMNQANGADLNPDMLTVVKHDMDERI